MSASRVSEKRNTLAASSIVKPWCSDGAFKVLRSFLLCFIPQASQVSLPDSDVFLRFCIVSKIKGKV